MADQIVSYTLSDGVATITMDDGKNNLVTPTMIKQVNKALDRAEKDNAVVILTGRDGVFCAGFDLKVLRSGVTDAYEMLIGGFELSARLLAHPTPVVIAANGHAIAMGSFLILSGDYRVGAAGEFKIAANEVAIGLNVPYSALEVCRQRLTPAHFVRATTLSEYYNPATAVDAGFLDEVVAPDQLQTRARELAVSYTKLDLDAHKATKFRIRKKLLKAVSKGIAKDRLDFLSMGAKRIIKPKKKS